MNYFVSGLVNVETYLRVRSFPVTYYPIDYPFFGITTEVSGVGFCVYDILGAFGDDADFVTLIGKDAEAWRVKAELEKAAVDPAHIFDILDCTPSSVVLYEPNGGRQQFYCDLKDVQDKTIDPESVRSAIEKSDVCVLCNVNFNRALLPIAKAAGKTIATDVHIISDVKDEFNKDFMRYADILFLSDEDLPSTPREFINTLKKEYTSKVIVIGLGSDGAIMYDRDIDTVYELPAVALGPIASRLGAGDALFAAFLHYYGRYSNIEALKRAEIFTALNMRRDRKKIGYPSISEVEKIYSVYDFK